MLKRFTLVLVLVAAGASVAATAAEPASKATTTTKVATGVKELMTRNFIGMPGREVRMETVEYAPGGKSKPHRHNAQIFVYVLEGNVRMQVKGSALVTLGPGDTFYEGPDDEHLVSENASESKPAKFLAVSIRKKAAGGKS
jgi:quercetin dioxygenase-like cupin family protein